MQARSSAMTTDPEPMWAPAARSASNSYGRVQEVRGQDAAGRSAHQDGLEPAAAGAAREPYQLAQGRAQRDLGDAAALGAAQLDEGRAGAGRGADRRERLARR